MDTLPAVDAPAPDFTLPATGDGDVSLGSLAGHPVVLWFYPRDATPGCTAEGQDFTAHAAAFDTANVVILGVSRDPVASHEKFRAKHAMPFALLSDEPGDVCRAYGVLKMKKMYGKEFEGIERSTFLIDGAGVLRHEWRKVKVPGHVEAVLAAVREL